MPNFNLNKGNLERLIDFSDLTTSGFRKKYAPGGSYEMHEEMKKRIKADPKIIGLDGIVVSYEEVPLIDKKNNLRGMIDLELRDYLGRNYIIEVKSGELDDEKLERCERKLKRYKHLYSELSGKICDGGLLVYRKKGEIAYKRV